MRRRAFLVLGFVAVAALAVLLYRRVTTGDRDPGLVRLPDADDIEAITAEVTDRTDNFGFHPIPKFTVPRKHYPLLLSVLTPAERNELLQGQVEQHPDIFPVIGRLTIATKRGDEIRITYYFVGQSPLVFAVDGQLCQRGGQYMPKVPRPAAVMGIDEGVLLYEVVHALYWEAVKGHRTERLPELRRLIERSTRKAPPAK
jgi:hypothetical protein